MRSEGKGPGEHKADVDWKQRKLVRGLQFAGAGLIALRISIPLIRKAGKILGGLQA